MRIAWMVSLLVLSTTVLQIKAGSVIRIELTDGSAIELPIKEDQLDVGRAKLPAGATAKLLPAEWPGKRKN